MSSENSFTKVELARSQIMDAVASHLHGLGIARNMEIAEMEIFGLPKQDLIPITFKQVPIGSDYLFEREVYKRKEVTEIASLA